MKPLRSIFSIVLALLVLVSSTSFMMGMHLCMGEVENVALFKKAEGCEKEQSLPPCHRSTAAPCCDDETVVHKGDDFKASIAGLAFHFAAVDIEHQLVLLSLIIPDAPLSDFKYYSYDPPLRSSDLTVEHQVFLI